MATYVVGDVHGCFTELEQLLSLINFSKNDQLWFTGDLVNGGSESVETLEFIKSLGDKAICVLGNHDLTLLGIEYGNLKINNDRPLGFTEILNNSNKENLLSWLKSKPLIHYDAKFNTLLVHAGLAPQWTLEEALKLGKEVQLMLQSNRASTFFENMFGNQPSMWQDNLSSWDRFRCIVNYMTRTRFCTTNGQLDFKYKGPLNSAPKDLIPWFEIDGRKTNNVEIVFGHWAALQGKTGQEKNGIFALDTGCVWGDKLSALRLEDKKIFAVDSLQEIH